MQKFFSNMKTKIMLSIFCWTRNRRMNYFIFFFEIKFKILRNYLLKNLILNFIWKFINRANALMFFVFKKNNSFYFYVNYKRLNTFIIKNKCLFFLIDETLNRLMSVVYFIKFNFKNTYYRIKICKSDKWMITFRTRYNHFEYIIMFFELVNVFVTF